MQFRARVFPFVLAILIMSGATLAQQRFDSVEITSQEAGEGIYMLVGAGGNLGVCVGEDGVFVIDDQYAPLTERILAAIAKLDQRPLRFVLNTHWHGDHTGGNEKMGAAGALIVAHENVRKRMSTDQFMKAFDNAVPASPAAALPVVTFSDEITFHLNGQTIRAWHPVHAHTDGDAMVYFAESDVLHTGDVVFNGMYPFIDVSSGGSIDGMISAVYDAIKIIGPETAVIPGHGTMTDIAGLKLYVSMLEGVRHSVAKLLADGKSSDEAIAAKPTAEWDEAWGQGFIKPDKMTEIVYDSLSN